MLPEDIKTRQEIAAENRKKFLENRRKWWEADHVLTKPEDVPDIPVTTDKEEQQFYIDRLIAFGAIPKRNLVVGHTYLGNCRNATTAIWKGNFFTYQRTKFGDTYEEKINHFEDDDGYDVFVPIREIP